MPLREWAEGEALLLGALMSVTTAVLVGLGSVAVGFALRCLYGIAVAVAGIRSALEHLDEIEEGVRRRRGPP